MNTIAYKIRKIRELKNLSQDYVSLQLGIGQTSYSRIESGHQELSITQLIELSRIFEVSVIDIINFDDTHLFHTQRPANESTAQSIINNLAQELIRHFESRIKHIEEEIILLRKK